MNLLFIDRENRQKKQTETSDYLFFTGWAEESLLSVSIADLGECCAAPAQPFSGTGIVTDLGRLSAGKPGVFGNLEDMLLVLLADLSRSAIRMIASRDNRSFICQPFACERLVNTPYLPYSRQKKRLKWFLCFGVKPTETTVRALSLHTNYFNCLGLIKLELNQKISDRKIDSLIFKSI